MPTVTFDCTSDLVVIPDVKPPPAGFPSDRPVMLVVANKTGGDGSTVTPTEEGNGFRFPGNSLESDDQIVVSYRLFGLGTTDPSTFTAVVTFQQEGTEPVADPSAPGQGNVYSEPFDDEVDEIQVVTACQ